MARVRYIAHERITNARFGLFFYSQDDVLLCQFTTEISGERLDLKPGTGTIEFLCPELGLQPGLYLVDATIEDNDWQFRCARVRVDPGKTVRGTFYSPHEWRLVEGEPTASANNTESLFTELASRV